jgi:O-acetyl-ADP-ribose deacetylase (regulator of RNase III)
MSIRLEKGDLFKVEANAIGHGVNCEGAMGAGIAKAFKARWPQMFDDYRSMCNLGVTPGFAEVYLTDQDQMIVNLFTQDKPGPNASKEWLRLALADASQKLYNYSDPDAGKVVFAMPLVGCGIGGLEFNDLWSTLNLMDQIWGRYIDYVVVYNDDNEGLIPKETVNPHG